MPSKPEYHKLSNANLCCGLPQTGWITGYIRWTNPAFVWQSCLFVCLWVPWSAYFCLLRYSRWRKNIVGKWDVQDGCQTCLWLLNRTLSCTVELQCILKGLCSWKWKRKLLIQYLCNSCFRYLKCIYSSLSHSIYFMHFISTIVFFSIFSHTSFCLDLVQLYKWDFCFPS